MSARINKQEKEKIRKEILETAFKLFSQKGYEDTKTKDISEFVGIAEGTLFNYFSSKANLYMEAMLENIDLSGDELLSEDITHENIIEIILEYITKSFKIVFKLPKTVIKEILHLSTFLSKKKRKIFNKFAETDFKAMEELARLIKQMQEKGFLKEINPETAASTIFAAVFFELLLYTYEDQYDKDDMMASLRKKVELIITPYIR